MNNVLKTIGYEGASPEDFVATLHEADVSHIIDVRDIAVSRRKGFSKSQLQLILEANGIRYTHLRGLGDPKAGRDAARSGDISTFRKIYFDRLKSKEAQSDLRKLIEIASGESVCLLCYERDPTHCHRTIIAQRVAKSTGITVTSVGVRDGIARTNRKRRNVGSDSSGESRAAL